MQRCSCEAAPRFPGFRSFPSQILSGKSEFVSQQLELLAETGRS